jgi:undecaprenyl-diphosphatase
MSGRVKLVHVNAARERFFPAHPGRAVAGAVVLLAVVALMAVLVPATPLGIDRSWAEAMQDIPSSLLRHVALFLDWLGRWPGITVTLGLIAVVLARARRWLAFAAFAVVELLALGSSSLLKALTQRARPPDGVIHPHGTSFPSGHTTYAGATLVSLVLVFTPPGRGRRWWWLLAGVGTAAMGWSRTYLEVHWLSDVIAGALLGVGLALLVFGVVQIVRTSGAASAGTTDYPPPSAP